MRSCERRIASRLWASIKWDRPSVGRRDGATAAKLRFNTFVHLEFQLIHSADTEADIVTPVREALTLLVRRAAGSETRLIRSDRLPAYSTETVDIEVLQGNHEWREVASTSRRTVFPVVPGFKSCNVFEVAALSQGSL